MISKYHGLSSTTASSEHLILDDTLSAVYELQLRNSEIKNVAQKNASGGLAITQAKVVASQPNDKPWDSLMDSCSSCSSNPRLTMSKKEN